MSDLASSRCAACKYLRRRCPQDCMFSPYFPANDPERFAFVHRIYGASNVGKLLQQLPEGVRSQAADTLFYEARSRMQDPVYGCAGIISRLQQHIEDLESEIAKTQAELALYLNSNIILGGSNIQQHALTDYQSIGNLSNGQNGVEKPVSGTSMQGPQYI